MADKNISQFNTVNPIARNDLFPLWDASAVATAKIQTSLLLSGPLRIVAPSGYDGYADYYTDGTADDVEINQALTDISSVGGRVLIRSGNYNITQPINIPANNIMLQGEGKSTYIKVVNASNVHGITIAAKSNVTVSDLYLDGNGVNQTIEVHGIRIGQASSYINIFNCKVINASHHGIHSILDTGFALNQYVRVINCEVANAGSLIETNPDGGCITMQASYGLVKNCYLTDTSFCGIELYHDGDHCVAVDNFIVWNGESDSLGAIQVGVNNENAIVANNVITGIGVSGTGAIKVVANYCNVYGNTIFDLTNGFGIWISGSANSLINSNIIKNLSADGIYIEGTYCTISSNNVINCLNGINARPTSFYNNISNNIVSGNKNNGIFVNAAAKSLVISGNQCINNSQTTANTWDGIASQGANCTITNNQCYDNQATKTQRYGISVTSASVTGNVIDENVVSSNQTGAILISSIGSGNIIRNNQGFLTEASGTATVTNGTTSIVVSHGLARTPALQDITVTPNNNLGSAAKFWVSGVTSTQFTINTDVNPGATTAQFAWKAVIL